MTCPLTDCLYHDCGGWEQYHWDGVDVFCKLYIPYDLDPKEEYYAEKDGYREGK